MGTLVVLGAFYLRGQAEQPGEDGIAVTAAPERKYIEPVDSDGDGTQDWEEGLSARTYESITLPSTLVASTTYTPPTTFTGKFSEAFFQDYMSGKIENDGEVDAETLVSNAVVAIEESTKSRTYSRLEIITVPTTDESVRAYGNRIMEIVRDRSINNEHEMVILERALSKNDPTILEELRPIQTVYEQIIKDTLLVPTPDEFVKEHIDMLNANEAILTDLIAMQKTFTDPLYALARTKGYENDTLLLFHAFKNMGAKLTARGITYAKDEPGAIFYLFE